MDILPISYAAVFIENPLQYFLLERMLANLLLIDRDS
jgi:hypothetical protein